MANYTAEQAARLVRKEFWNSVEDYGWKPEQANQLAEVLARPLQIYDDQIRLQQKLGQILYENSGGRVSPLYSTAQEIKDALITNTMSTAWGNISPKIAVSNPEGATYLAFNSPTDAMKQAYSMSFEYLTQIYGDEYVAAYMQAALISNPDNHKATMQVLDRILAYEAPDLPAAKAATPQQAAAGAALGGVVGPGEAPPWEQVQGAQQQGAAGTGTVAPDVLYQVLTDPSSYNDLTPAQKLALRDMVASIQPQIDRWKGEHGGETFTKIAAIIGTEKGTSIALSPEEIDQLNNITQYITGEEGSTLRPSNPAAPGEQNVALPELGVISLSARGAGEAGTIRMDRDWAQKHPVKAVAVERQLLERFPGVQFVYGGSGVLGDSMDLLGMPIDAIGGALAGGVEFLSERYVENALTSHNDRVDAAREAAALRQKLADGQIPADKIDDANRTLYRLDDLAEQRGQNVFDDIGSNVGKALTGQVSGLGFTEPLLAGVDYRPGDPGYAGVSALVTIAGMIYLDPLAWSPAVLRGIKLAETVPRGVEDVAKLSHSLITRSVYRVLAQTPEEMWAGKIGRVALDRLWDAKVAMEPGEFGSAMGRYLGLDTDTTRLLMGAKTKDELDHALLYISTGRAYDWGDHGALLTQLNEVAGQLDEIKALPEKIAAYRARAAQAGSEAAGLHVVPPTAEKALPPVQEGFVRLYRGENKTYDAVRNTYWSPNRTLAEDYAKGGNLYYVDVPEDAPWLTKSEGIAPGTNRYKPEGVPPTPHLTQEGMPEEVAREAQRVYPPTTPHGLVQITPEAQSRLDQLQMERIDALTRSHELQDVYDVSKAAEDDLIAQYAYLRSAWEGRMFESATPLMHPPTAAVLRRILPEGPFEKTYIAMADFVGAFPGNILDTIGAKRLMNYLFTKEGRQAEQTAKEFLGFRLHFYANETGAGEHIIFPWTTGSKTVLRRANLDVADITIDMAQRSYNHVFDFFRRLGFSESEATQRLAGWHEITDAGRGYRWWVDTYTGAILDSPVLPTAIKKEWTDIWPELLGERSPGYITETKGGVLIPRETNFTLVPSKTDPSKMIRSGSVSFTGDMLQSVKLPTFQDMQEYMSFYRRMLANWQEFGHVRKPVAEFLTWWHRTWSWINTEWKYLVLIGRMPTALPMRIVSEEMVRMAAYDYASAVSHPFEWFKSLRSADEYELFAESPVGLLGTLRRQYNEAEGNIRLAREGRQIVTIDDGDHYFNSLSGILGKRFKYASPETPELLTRSPQDFLRWAESEEGVARIGEGFLQNIDNVVASGGVASREEFVRNMQLELAGYIGTGEGAKDIKAALFNGRITRGDDVFEVGTQEFAKELRRMFDAGEWKPDAAFLARFAGDYLPLQQNSLVALFVPFRDMLFKKMYSAPDLYFARSPLYRQIATREFSTLRALGYSETMAKEVAKYRAADRTASLMFNIGAHTPAEFALRNLMPFFPAWRELATTWLYSIPKSLGGGSLLAGYPILARRADSWIKLLQETGVLRQDTQGNYVIPVPGLGTVLGKLFGTDIPFKVAIPAESAAGLLPIPTPGRGGFTGVLPTLGAPSALALAKLNQFSGNKYDGIEAMFTMFGGDTSLGPATLDRFLGAFGITPPWMSNATQQYTEAVRNWAVIDGIQIYIMDHPAPVLPKGDLSPSEQKKYIKEWDTWTQDALGYGESYAMRSYFLRTAAGAVFPFSVNWTPESEAQLRSVQTVLAAMPERVKLSSPFLDTFKASHPGAWAMMTGKTISAQNGGIDPNNFEQFRQDIRNGKVDILNPEEWMRFAYGMNSYFVYLNQRSELYAEIGTNPRMALLSGWDRTHRLAELDRDWQNFLDMSVVVAEQEGGGRAFGGDNGLFAEWERSRYGTDKPSLSIEQNRAIEVKKLLGELGVSLSPNRADADFKTMSGRLSEMIGDPGYSKPTTKVGKAMDWWWRKVGDPYLEKVDAVWEEINQTPGALRAPLYDRLAQLDNKFYHDTPSQWGKLPSPQEVFFENMAPRDQKARLIEEATLPPWYLGSFYREKLGYTGDQDKMQALASFINNKDTELSVIVAQQHISYSSNEYEGLKARMEAEKRAMAQRLGLEKVYNLWQQPTYKRVDVALGLGGVNESWTMIVRTADQMYANMAAEDVSPNGSSAVAQVYQRLLVQKIETARKNDPNFDNLMSTFEQAMGKDGRPLVGPDMYMKLFFDTFSDSAPMYIYTR